MYKCEKEEKFTEAAKARDRIKKLKKIENKKLLKELKQKHQEDVNHL